MDSDTDTDTSGTSGEILFLGKKYRKQFKFEKIKSDLDREERSRLEKEQKRKKEHRRRKADKSMNILFRAFLRAKMRKNMEQAHRDREKFFGRKLPIPSSPIPSITSDSSEMSPMSDAQVREVFFEEVKFRRDHDLEYSEAKKEPVDEEAIIAEQEEQEEIFGLPCDEDDPDDPDDPDDADDDNVPDVHDPDDPGQDADDEAEEE